MPSPKPPPGRTWAQIVEEYPAVRHRIGREVQRAAATGVKPEGRDHETNRLVAAHFEVSASMLSRVLFVGRVVADEEMPMPVRKFADTALRSFGVTIGVHTTTTRIREIVRLIHAEEPHEAELARAKREYRLLVDERARVEQVAKLGSLKRPPIADEVRRVFGRIDRLLNTLDRVAGDERFPAFAASVPEPLRAEVARSWVRLGEFAMRLNPGADTLQQVAKSVTTTTTTKD